MPKLGLGLTLSVPRVASAPLIPASGLSLWLKADTGVTTSGSNVTAWADQSPSNLTFLADATTSDITLNSNYTNGKPAIIFSSASEGGSMGLSNSSVFVTKSVFIALAPNGDNFEYAVPYENNGLNIYSTPQNYGAPWGSYLNGNVNALTTLSANGTKYLLSATSDTGEDAQFYLNGANDTDSSGAGFYNERSEIVIGNGGARGSFNQQFEGAIMEIVAYNRVLTTPERQQVEAYLMSKYAIEPPPSGIPLSTTNINITYSGTTRTLVKQSNTFWYNERYGPNDPGTCEVPRYSLRYQNSQWEFLIYNNFIDDGCQPGDEVLTSTNAGASSSIPDSSWSPSITITAA